MPDARILRQHILGGRDDALFSALYGEAAVERQRLRYTELIDEFRKPSATGRYISSPLPDGPKSAAIIPTIITAGYWPPASIWM